MEKYVIGFLVKSEKRELVRDITNTLKETIEQQPLLEKEFKLIDCGYVAQDNLEQLIKFMKRKNYE